MSKRKDTQGAGGADAGATVSVITVAGHPRSARAVRRAKGLGGLLGTVLATLLALNAGLPLLDAMMRGIVGGIVGYVVLWAVALSVARQLVIAEIRARHAQLMRAAAAADADGS